MKKDEQALKKIIEQAVQSDIENVYFNGFTNSIGVGDIIILLQRNGKPVKLLNVSYTVAKTLAIKLLESINFFEDKTNQKMLTTDQVESCFGMGDKDAGADIK